MDNDDDAKIVAAPIPPSEDSRYALAPVELKVIFDVIMRTQFSGSESFGVSQLLTKLEYWLKKAG